MVLLNKFKNLSLDDKLGILLFLISFIFLAISVKNCFKTSIWMDEAFSLLLIQKSYVGIVTTTISDVHPPLYYFILKFGVELFQNSDLTVNSTIIIAKFISLFPIILLLGVSIFKFRTNFGWLFIGIFSICLTSMPNFMYYSVDIRMYSWALFFVTMCFIYAYEVSYESNIKNWIILGLFGVCAAYTHYFAAVSVVMVFLLLLIYLTVNNKTEIKKWVMSVLGSSLIYSFWLIPLFNQVIKVTKSYWIGPITLYVIVNYLFFIFSPLSSIPFFSVKVSSIQYIFNNVIGFLLLGAYLIIFVKFIKSKTECSKNFIVSGFFVLILTVLFGVLVSILIKPVFFDRYIVPSLGIFWLVFAFLLSKSWNYKKIFVPVLFIVLLVSTFSTVAFVDYESVAQKDYDILDSFLKQESIKNDDFIVDGTETNILPEFYIIKYLLGNYHNIDPSDELYPVLNSNKTIWLFSSESRGNVLKNFEEQNLTIQKYIVCPGIAYSGVYENKEYTIYKISQNVT